MSWIFTYILNALILMKNDMDIVKEILQEDIEKRTYLQTF